MEFAFYKGAQPGMQKLTQSLLGASMLRDRARDTELGSIADTDLKGAQADKVRTESSLLSQKLARAAQVDQDIERAGAGMSGVSIPEFRDFSEFRRSGIMPSRTGENQDVGPVQPKYAWTPEQQARIDRAIATLSLGRQAKEINPEQLADTAGKFQGQQTTENVLDAIRRGQMQAASALNQGGKLGTQLKLYDDIGNTGAVLAPATGEVQTNNALAQIELDRRGADVKLKGAQAQHATDTGRAALINADRPRVGPGGGTRAPMGYRLSSDGETLEPIPGGPKDARPLPTSAAQKLMENQQNLRRAEQALQLVSGQDITDENGEVMLKGDKQATGWKGVLPEFILQRVDSAGVTTRAAIADLGSLIIHDRSGAAVTAAEFPRLRPFVPRPTDDQATVQQKLVRFVDEYRKVVAEAADFYVQSGYRVPTNALKPSGANAGAVGSWDGKERRQPPAAGQFKVLGVEKP